MNEPKSIVSMYQYGYVIAKNAYEAALGSNKFITMPSEFHFLSVIPIGTKNGLMIFNNMVVSKPDAYAAKNDM